MVNTGLHEGLRLLLVQQIMFVRKHVVIATFYNNVNCVTATFSATISFAILLDLGAIAANKAG